MLLLCIIQITLLPYLNKNSLTIELSWKINFLESILGIIKKYTSPSFTPVFWKHHHIHTQVPSKEVARVKFSNFSNFYDVKRSLQNVLNWKPSNKQAINVLTTCQLKNVQLFFMPLYQQLVTTKWSPFAW